MFSLQLMFGLALKSDREALNLFQKRRPKETFDNIYDKTICSHVLVLRNLKTYCKQEDFKQRIIIRSFTSRGKTKTKDFCLQIYRPI